MGHNNMQTFRRRSLIQMFLEILMATAFADGHLDDNEKNILLQIAADLGYSRAQFDELVYRLSGQMHFASEESRQQKLAAAYELLGLGPDCSEAELKKAYRRQMNQHHPDKLVAKGLPDEMIDLAEEKTREIRAAYELIRERRN